MKNLGTRTSSSNRGARADLAERRIAIEIAQSRALLAGITEQLDVTQLSDETQALLEIASECPVLCAAVGPAAVAEKMRLSDGTVRYIAWLELTPARERNALPSLEESLKILSLVPECGALNQWRREVAARYRKVTDIDALSRGAIYEANARDELRLGLHGAACESRRLAAAIIVQSRAERVA